jgi:putative heme iron utilization protein
MAEPPRRDPVMPADDAARTLARRLIAEARHAALAVLEPGSGAPFVSRIAVAPAADGAALTLISTLSAHTGALLADPRCALLFGEPGPRGDPLTHPRLSLRARAVFASGAEAEALRAAYVAARPKATLYAGFADFRPVRFEPVSALLNGGFGRAHALTAADLLG